MKTLVGAMCLIFAGLFGLTLYTHYDTKKFIQNLPQPPIPRGEVAPAEKTPIPREARTPENQGEQTLEDPLPALHTHDNFHEHPGSHGHTHPDDSLVESAHVSESDAMHNTEAPVEETSSVEQLPPGVVPWKRVGPDGTVEVDREAFLAEFGNTPEAYTYLTLHRKINTADSYTYREIYEYQLLEKEFTQDPNILPSHLEKMRQNAIKNPDGKLPSWRALKNDPNIRIIEK